MSGSGKIRDRVALTARYIEALKPDPSAPYSVKDTRTAGLVLRVAQSGEKTWPLSFRISGAARIQHVSLGRYGDPGASLDEARARANQLTAAARQGIDLIGAEAEARETASRAMSMEKFVELYLARRVRRRLRSAHEVERILKRVLAPLANVPAANIRRRDVSPLLEAIAAAGHERAAGNARALIGGLFRWGEMQEIVAGDPTRGLPRYDRGSPRDRVLDADEIRAVWPWFENLSSSICEALRFQLLTGCRIGEVVGMTDSEVDRGKWLWTLPAGRSKNGRKRVTPLVGQARAIIETRLEGADEGLLFLAERGGTLTSASIATALHSRRKQMPILTFTSHDLRRTLVSTMLELGVSRDVIGAIIGHDGDSDKAARILIKHYIWSDLVERKRPALEAWDAHLKAIVSGQVPGDNVVQIRA